MLKRSNIVAFLSLGFLVVSRSFTPLLYHYTLGFTIDALLIAIFIAQAVMLHDSPLWNWLENPVSRYIGRISYPMYLYHVWAIGAALKFHLRPSILAAILVTAALGSISFYAVEKPFLRLKDRWER